MPETSRTALARDFYGIPFRVRSVVRAGGVIAYPTEGVYGLGCLPTSAPGIQRILDIKGRDADKGLILIAADVRQLRPWVALDAHALSRLEEAYAIAPTERARTYIVAASERCPNTVTGGRDTVAVRVTRYAVAADLCRAADSALISTSANISGRPAITRPAQLRSTFGADVDAVLGRATGQQAGVSQIIDFASGTVLRA